MSTRRSFLVLTSGAALASALPKSLLAQSGENDLFSSRNLGAYSQGLLSRTAFESVVGSMFTLFFESGDTASLVLLGVSSPRLRTSASSQVAAALAARQLPQTAATVANKTGPSCFLLSFSTGLTSVPQATYRLDHGTLGSFTVFLVPGEARHGGTCTACFNYL